MANLNDSEYINRAWENIKKNITVSARDSLGRCEWKQHNPWFNEQFLRFLPQRKQALIQWLQNRNRSNVDNRNSVRREAGRHFRNKKKEYLKLKFINLKLIVSPRISETCIAASMISEGLPA